MWMGFLIVEILCFLYFAFSRRRFDLFAVANLEATFYMLPLFVGRIPKIGIEGVLTRQLIDLDPRIYVFGYAVIVAPTLIGILYDRLMPAAREPRPDRSYAGWYLLLALIGIAIHASTTSLFSADKAVALEHIGFSFTLFETAMCLAILDAFKKRRWVIFALAICLLILDVAVGFRFNLVLVTIACVLLWLAEKGPIQLSSRLHAYCAIALTLLVLGVSANPVRLHGVKVAFEYLSVPNNLYDEFFRLEPFVTQAIANESFRNELSCHQYDWRQFALLVVPLPRLLNFQPELFEVQYKPLFPDVKFGLAGNPWAEAFCRDGWIGFFLVLAFFTLILIAIQLALDFGAAPTPAVALCGVIVAFYVHRNDPYFLVVLLRRVAILAFVVWTFHFLLAATRSRIDRYRAPLSVH